MEAKDFPLALVTGAAHRLGLAFATALADRGYAILLHYHRSEKEAVSAEAALRNRNVPVYPFRADLVDPVEIDRMFSFMDSLPHVLRVLVNSAAVMQRGDIQTMSVEEWDTTFALNLRAPFFVAQQAAWRMNAGGLIVNVTDAGAAKAWTGFPAYSVSKAGLESLTRLLAKGLAPGIRVNAIAPGLALPSEQVSPAEWERLIGRLPLKRPARLEEMCAALAYLIDNEAVTGQTLAVESGYSLI